MQQTCKTAPEEPDKESTANDETNLPCTQISLAMDSSGLQRIFANLEY
jgi:hypothetical protein